jgi:hypothetical protein
MKKLLALLLCLAILAVGFCACADDPETPDTGSETESVTETQQNEDTSKDNTGDNGDDQTPDGPTDDDKETIKEPEGTASSDPDGDGQWTPNY